MTTRARIRVNCILFVIVAMILSVWFFSSDLKIQLFDLPALEAEKQSVVQIISMTSMNDRLFEESHYPLRKITWCLWGYDAWTYKSSRTRSELVNAFDQSFVSWSKMSSPTKGIIYIRDSFSVEIEWNVSDANAGNTYIIRLSTNDPPDPRCSI